MLNFATRWQQASNFDEKKEKKFLTPGPSKVHLRQDPQIQSRTLYRWATGENGDFAKITNVLFFMFSVLQQNCDIKTFLKWNCRTLKMNLVAWVYFEKRLNLLDLAKFKKLHQLVNWLSFMYQLCILFFNEIELLPKIAIKICAPK